MLAIQYLLVLSIILGFFIFLTDSYAEEFSIPPRQQWKEVNDIDQITCKEGLVLIQKHNDNPACVSSLAYLRLLDRGYGEFDPSTIMERQEMVVSIMKSMTSDDNLLHHWNQVLLNDAELMQKTMNNWISQMKTNSEFLEIVMGPMTSDPKLRDQMIQHMKEHPRMEKSLLDHKEWMDSVHRPRIELGLNNGMEHETCSWCPKYEENQMKTSRFSNPQKIMDIINHIWINPNLTIDMHNYVLSNSRNMAEIEKQMMAEMLYHMMDDSDLRKEMIELMLDNQEFMNSIRHANQP